MWSKAGLVVDQAPHLQRPQSWFQSQPVAPSSPLITVNKGSHIQDQILTVIFILMRLQAGFESALDLS